VALLDSCIWRRQPIDVRERIEQRGLVCSQGFVELGLIGQAY
jgi:hypothetical protein